MLAGRARQHQAGDVRARDEQHARDGAEERQRAVADVARDLLAERHEREAPAGIEERIRGRESGGNRVRFGARLGQRRRPGRSRPSTPIERAPLAKRRPSNGSAPSGIQTSVFAGKVRNEKSAGRTPTISIARLSSDERAPDDVRRRLRIAAATRRAR